jgi:hypothetical protein
MIENEWLRLCKEYRKPAAKFMRDEKNIVKGL